MRVTRWRFQQPKVPVKSKRIKEKIWGWIKGWIRPVLLVLAAAVTLIILSHVTIEREAWSKKSEVTDLESNSQSRIALIEFGYLFKISLRTKSIIVVDYPSPNEGRDKDDGKMAPVTAEGACFVLFPGRASMDAWN